MNLCRSCELDFGSVAAFDAHRVGRHAYLWSPEREDGRRCLSLEEMEGGLFERNARGAWSLSKSLAAARLLRNSPPKREGSGDAGYRAESEAA